MNQEKHKELEKEWTEYVRGYLTRIGGIKDEVKIIRIAGNLWQVVLRFLIQYESYHESHIEWEKNLNNSEVARAVVALSKIIDFNHITPDIQKTASFMLENYQKQKEVEYVMYLRNEIERLNTLLTQHEAQIREEERERIKIWVKDSFMPSGTMDDYHQGWNDCCNKILSFLTPSPKEEENKE